MPAEVLHRFLVLGFCEFRTASRATGVLAGLGCEARTTTSAIDPGAPAGDLPQRELDTLLAARPSERGDAPCCSRCAAA